MGWTLCNSYLVAVVVQVKLNQDVLRPGDDRRQVYPERTADIQSLVMLQCIPAVPDSDDQGSPAWIIVLN